ncbi:lysophospholipase [Parasphingorhabdus pacifica]
MTSAEREVSGSAGRLFVRTWEPRAPEWIALLVHGYGEHSGRYEWVAEQLTDAGAVVWAPDHVGHGHSDGERVLIKDAESVVADLDVVRETVVGEHPGLPVVLIGHSLGGMFAARYAQSHQDELAAVVLSAPVLGTWYVLDLLEGDEIPDTPIDPGALSRDPAMGSDYVADPLVWHGPFKRSTLRAIDRCLEHVNDGPPLRAPTLWLHGDDDEIVPEADTRTGIDRVRGQDFQEHIYVGARHEVFNETNRAEVLRDLLTFVQRKLST